MFTNIMKSIPGIASYPIISLLVFLTIFAVVLFWVFVKVDRNYIRKMKKLPLDSSNSSITDGEQDG